MANRLVPNIHARGEASRLDAVLQLVTFAARPRPLSVALDELPRWVAKVFSADICSIYFLEGEDLVMRGNVGFPQIALGEVRLSVGKGITGLAVEYMRPITLNAAPEHESYQSFPLLGEEKFPIFLAVPIAGPKGPLGAMVLQRRSAPAFDAAEVELAAALTAPIAAVAERARLVDAMNRSPDTAGRGQQRVTLSGRTVVPGRALGVIHALPRPETRPAAEAPAKPAERSKRLDKALELARSALTTAERHARENPGQPEAQQEVTQLQTILDDARLRERVLEMAHASGGPGLSQALMDAAREALKTAQQIGSAFGVERAKRIAEVCEALCVLVSPSRTSAPRGAVWVGDELNATDLLIAGQLRPSAVVLSEPGSASSRRLLGLMKVPAVVEVSGFFKWSELGQLVLVDADHGIVRLNPSRVEVALLRQERQGRKERGA